MLVEIVDIRGRLESGEVRRVVDASYSIEYPASQRETQTDKILSGYRQRTDDRLDEAIDQQGNYIVLTGRLEGVVGL